MACSEHGQHAHSPALPPGCSPAGARRLAHRPAIDATAWPASKYVSTALWQCSAGAAAPPTTPRGREAPRLRAAFRLLYLQAAALGRCIGGAAEILSVYHSTDHCERFAELAPRHTRAQRVPSSSSEVRCSFCHLCVLAKVYHTSTYFSRATPSALSPAASAPCPWAHLPLICKRTTTPPFQSCNRSVQAGVLRCLQAAPCCPAALGTSGLEGPGRLRP
jgi:hypothetical protein